MTEEARDQRLVDASGTTAACAMMAPGTGGPPMGAAGRWRWHYRWIVVVVSATVNALAWGARPTHAWPARRGAVS